jgi:hypothetical protein
MVEIKLHEREEEAAGDELPATVLFNADGPRSASTIFVTLA